MEFEVQIYYLDLLRLFLTPLKLASMTQNLLTILNFIPISIHFIFYRTKMFPHQDRLPKTRVEFLVKQTSKDFTLRLQSL